MDVRSLGGVAPSKDDSLNAPAFRNALLTWFDNHGRDLPWRRKRSPYGTLVSEFMLQQTRVETVVPYYHRWLKEFPSVEALADADQEAVLQQWKGLGYYSRARRLHQAAQIVRERYDGEIPNNAEELRALPGVGEYTAGAVASMAFGEVTPAVDGNVRRVLARLYDVPSPSPKDLRRWGAALVDPQRPGTFNEAMMELGATVCSPKEPRCGSCPVRRVCKSLAAGTVAQRPTPIPRKKAPAGEFAVLMAQREDGRFLIMRRGGGGMLEGMWEFPSVEIAVGEGDDGVAGAVVEMAEELGLRGVRVINQVKPLRHVFSHLRATYRAVVVVVDGDAPSIGDVREEYRWLALHELDDVPLSRAQEKLAGQISGNTG